MRKNDEVAEQVFDKPSDMESDIAGYKQYRIPHEALLLYGLLDLFKQAAGQGRLQRKKALLFGNGYSFRKCFLDT